MNRILVIGASGHARVVVDILECVTGWEIVGFADRGDGSARGESYPILGRDTDLVAIREQHPFDAAVVAIGDNWSRRQAALSAAEQIPGLEFATAVHPAASVARGVELGAGTVVMAGAVINVGTRVGRHVIVNTRASVDHDARLGDFTSVAPGAVLGGDVHVGELSAVSLGAMIIHGRRVGEATVIGAGSVVLDDIPDRVVAHGTPARVIRERSPSMRYL